MKTVLAIVAGITVLMAAITNRVSVNTNSASGNRSCGPTVLGKGSYLASDYVQFKKENGLMNISSVVPASEKVLFKAFVEHKRKLDN